jgi:hypothetical protein
VSPDRPEFDQEFTIVSATANTFLIDSPLLLRLPPEGTFTKSGPVWHDGSQTAYLRTTIQGWSPGYRLRLESSTNAYNGVFEVQRISDRWYSFAVDWLNVRETLETRVLPGTLILGTGTDFLSIPGTLVRTLNLFSPVGGTDTLRVVGGLTSTQRIVSGEYSNVGLQISHTGLGVSNFMTRLRT